MSDSSLMAEVSAVKINDGQYEMSWKELDEGFLDTYGKFLWIKCSLVFSDKIDIIYYVEHRLGEWYARDIAAMLNGDQNKVEVTDR